MIDRSFIGISVGNTRTQLGRFDEGELIREVRATNDDLATIVQHAAEMHQEHGSPSKPVIVLASVNDPFALRAESAIIGQLKADVYRVGDDLPVAIGTRLDPETITGVDRLLNAAAAYATMRQACVIIDAGTAITIDFVDGQGTFHGGAIAPGATMQLQALHQHTAALPELTFRAPDAEPFGRNTTQAMLQGVFHGIRGMTQRLIERYAEHFGAFPAVIATGGDAPTIFADEELIDRIVPDLTLRGIALSVRAACTGSIDGDDADRSPRTA